MKFGKVSDLTQIDFSLPELEILNPSKKPNLAPRIYLGTTGWSNKEWLGNYYPKKINSTEYVQHYAALFDTIELNTTHYHIPDLDKVASWCNQVDKSFKFCPKIPQIISHRSNIASETSQSHTFFKAIETMGDNLGPSFMQLPEYFDPKQEDKLLRFLSRKPAHIPLSLELRHAKWFDEDNQALRRLAKQLVNFNTSLVVTDVAGRRDVCHNLLPTATLIVRLVGNALHESDFSRMHAWADLIQKNQNNLNDVYLFFHQPSMKDIPSMINYFIASAEKIGLEGDFELLKPNYQENSQLSLF